MAHESRKFKTSLRTLGIKAMFSEISPVLLSCLCFCLLLRTCPPAARLYRPSSTLTQKGVSSSLPTSEYELLLVRVQSRAHLWSNQRGQADGSRDRPGLVGTEFAALSEPHGRKRHFSSPSKGVLLPKGGRGCWVNKG